MINYKASLDKTALIITSITTIMFGALILFKFVLSAALILLTTYLICLLLMPLSYQISDDKLIIRRLIKSVHIKRSDILSLETVDKSLISGSIRTFAVGGLFGWFGKFANTQVGSMTWYVSRRDKPVLIICKGGEKIVISPDEAERFVKDYKQGI